MGYSRGILNSLERITLSDLSHMMSIADPVAIGVGTLRIDSELSGEWVHCIDEYESLNSNYT